MSDFFSEEGQKEYVQSVITSHKNFIKIYKRSVKDCEDGVKRYKELCKKNPTSKSYSDSLKMEKEMLLMQKDALKREIKSLSIWQRDYLQHFGKRELTVIRGGLYSSNTIREVAV